MYAWDHIAERVSATREAFGGRFEISYAVKSNPNRALLSRLARVVEHFDISSGGELLVACEAECDPARFSFVGPGKRAWELRLALERGCGHVVAESEAELVTLDGLAREIGVTAPVVLRVNPRDLPSGFGAAMSRRPSPFGIDEEAIDSGIEAARRLEAVDLRGFHIYAGTQCLNEGSLAENLVNCAELFGALSARHELHPEVLIFGSGFGIPYHDGDASIDLAAIAGQAGPSLDRLCEDSWTGGARLLLELGRYLVGQAGTYVVRVLYSKTSREEQILVLDGGMNHHLGASGNLGAVIRRNYPIRNLGDGLDHAGQKRSTYELAGPLCTHIDSLGRKVELGPTGEGDLLAIGCSGAYGPTASPVGFITHPPPAEVLVAGSSDSPEFLDITSEGPLARPPAWPTACA